MSHRSARVACAALVLSASVSPLIHAADSPGEQVFTQCATCHTTDGTPSLGPTLKGIVGRDSASVPGFAYSGAMKRARLHWTAEQLDQYLADPQAVVPGNAMPYAGMSDPDQRKALIAYLATIK